MFKNVTPTNKV